MNKALCGALGIVLGCGWLATAQAVVIDFDGYTDGILNGQPESQADGDGLTVSGPWAHWLTPNDNENNWQVQSGAVADLDDIPGLAATPPSVYVTGDFSIGYVLEVSGLNQDYWFGYSAKLPNPDRLGGFATVNLRNRGQFGFGNPVIGAISRDGPNAWQARGVDIEPFQSTNAVFFLFHVKTSDPSSANHSVDVFIDPDLTAAAPTPDFVLTGDASGWEPLNSLPNRITVASGGKDMQVDNILISNSSPFSAGPPPDVTAPVLSAVVSRKLHG